MHPLRGIEKLLYPFHKTKNIIDNLNIAGISNAEKELLLTLMVKGRVELNYSHLPKLVSNTLGTPIRSKSTMHEAVKKLREKSYVKVLDSDRYLVLTTKGLIVAGKYVVLVRMMYTVPMTITLLLLLTILRPWTPWWFLGAATIVAILHHISNLVVLFMKPARQDLGLANRVARIIPELLPIILVLRTIATKITIVPKYLRLKDRSRKTMLSLHYVKGTTTYT